MNDPSLRLEISRIKNNDDLPVVSVATAVQQRRLDLSHQHQLTAVVTSHHDAPQATQRWCIHWLTDRQPIDMKSMYFHALRHDLSQPPLPKPPELSNSATPMRGKLKQIQAYITSLE